MRSVARWFLLWLILPLTAAAQRVTITPSFGAYVPLAPQTHQTYPVCPSRPPCYTETHRRRLDASAAYGVRLGAVWDDLVGFELSVATAETRLRRTILVDLDGGFTDASAMSARSTIVALRLNLQRSLGTWATLVGAVGVSRTSLSGPAYEGSVESGAIGWDLDRTIVGPTAGARLGIKLSRQATAEFGLSGHFYAVRTSEGSITQQDWLLQSGVVFGLGR